MSEPTLSAPCPSCGAPAAVRVNLHGYAYTECTRCAEAHAIPRRPAKDDRGDAQQAVAA